MKKMWLKKEFWIIGIMIALFLFVSILSLSSIRQLQGNARVVNYVGIVRGATQKLVKEELMGYQDNALIDRLDSIVTQLLTGEGPHELIVLPDKVYLGNMRQVKLHWERLQDEIDALRRGADPRILFESSQDYFTLVDRTVFSAEAYSEKQVSRTNNILIGANLVFVLFILISLAYFVRTLTIKRKADVLGKIAYVDPLTQIPNRASCERAISRLSNTCIKTSVTVLMFDMNNLKIVNDFLGHRGGDRIITEFAHILNDVAPHFGFMGRYGGDEFLGIFENSDKAKTEAYIKKIQERVAAYNSVRTNDIEKISYAVGCALGHMPTDNIQELINAADREMYISKRRIKETI